MAERATWTADAERAAEDSHHLVFLRQLPFTVVAAIVVGGIFLVRPANLADHSIVAAIIVAVAASTASIVIPWHRLDRRWAALVPAGDMAAIGLASTSGADVAPGLALPVLWLSRAYGMAGLVTSVLGGTVIVWLPQVLGAPVTDVSLPRLLVLPAVLGAIGTYMYFAERRSIARQRLLERQSGILERTLEDARRQRRLLEGVLNTIDVGVVAVNAEGEVIVRNRAQASLAPRTPAVGQSVETYVPDTLYGPDRRTALGADASPLVRASRRERVGRELVWFRTEEGAWRAVGVSSSPLSGNDGRWDGAVVVYQDLTPEMTAMAQQDDFVASVSHELRTPLTSVLGYAEVLSDDPALDERQRTYLRVVERNARRLLRLIGDLLAAGEINRGTLTLERTDVDLRDVVTEAIEAQSPFARERGVEVRDELDGPIRTHGDPARLAQVVDNVLTNAIKYSRRGGEVVVSGDRHDGHVLLRVRDHGVGIAVADQERVFQRFYRAEAVRGSKVSGTGLGLHITQELVSAHGGWVELDSEPGVGTEVRISLPEAP
ncbi:sensor histidine kinase [Georgenia halophila]|uniref:histidine kinase n=1 Tax=Georgenia halophila TaxID=620889 RepID=A0ABP8KTB7_9MICO